MRFTFDVEIDGIQRRLTAIADSAKDLERPLARIGGRVRARIKRDTFPSAGPGWEPLKEASAARKPTRQEVELLINRGRGKTGERSEVEKVVRDAKNADKWDARARQLTEKIGQRAAMGRSTATMEKRLAAAEKQRDWRLRDIRERGEYAAEGGIKDVVAFAQREVARRKLHGIALRRLKALRRSGVQLDEKDRRAISRMGARRYGAEASATQFDKKGRVQLLGSLSESMHMRVEGASVTIANHARIAPIHNFGGTAGNGARIPARPFMALKDSDLRFAVDVLREHMLEAWLED